VIVTGVPVETDLKNLGHELRHPNTTVGCGVAREIPGVHADTVDDAHKIRHGGAFEMAARRFLVVHRDVRHHDVTGVVNEVAIFG